MVNVDIKSYILMDSSRRSHRSATARISSRSILDARTAVEIYEHRVLAEGKGPGKNAGGVRRRSPSAALAKQYGVSPKAIRDIWNRRTWGFITSKVDTLAENGCVSANTWMKEIPCQEFESNIPNGNNRDSINIDDASTISGNWRLDVCENK